MEVGGQERVGAKQKKVRETRARKNPHRSSPRLDNTSTKGGRAGRFHISTEARALPPEATRRKRRHAACRRTTTRGRCLFGGGLTVAPKHRRCRDAAGAKAAALEEADVETAARAARRDAAVRADAANMAGMGEGIVY